MQNLLWVFVGAGSGGALRHLINLAFTPATGPGFPYATLFINVTGSWLMGLLAGYFALHGQGSPHWKLFLTTGVLGGYTTYSTFSLETILLWQRGRSDQALTYVGLSLVLGLTGLLAGLRLSRWLWPAP